MLIHALPIFHTHGLFVATNVTLFSGASMIFLPKFDVDRIFELMPRATVLMGVPTFYVRLLEDEMLNAETTAHMRVFISGSAPLLAETHREWQAKTGHAILERYGMTETNMNASNPYDGDRVAGTVGLPLPGVEIIVTDPETGAELAQGEVGMIEVRGPNVFKGYWRMPEKTAAELRDNGFFITGDLGKIDEKGYVHIVGRGKDLIITGGYNVYPKEIETEIDAIPGVLESAVVGVPHRDFGEGVTAVVVPTGKVALAEADVLKDLEDQARQVQAAEARAVRRRAAAQHHGQGPEEPAAREVRRPLSHLIPQIDSNRGGARGPAPLLWSENAAGCRRKMHDTYHGTQPGDPPECRRQFTAVEARRVAFRFSLQRRRPGHSTFRGSIPSPPFPLSTLRRRPRERRRMTRGRCGRLPLQRTTFSFASIHRPPGAQRLLDPSSRSSANLPTQPVLRSLASAEFSRCFRGL